MIAAPTRTSLVPQVAAYLRESIASAKWRETLPGEHHLCDLLKVSRPTLRLALRSLEREGLISARRGVPRAILRRGTAPAEPGSIVTFLSAVPLEALAQSSIYLYAKVSAHLRGLGFQCAFVSGKRLAGPHLERLVRRNPSRAWVLISCGEATQQWFCAHGLPAFLMGRPHRDVYLPSLDLDHFEVARHAARLLVAHGHERLGIVLPKVAAAGDLMARDGFLAALRQVGREGVVLPCENTRAAVQSLARKSRLHALYICNADAALAICSCLIRLGVDVPGDISLVSRDSNRAMETYFPDVSRYLDTSVAESRKLAALIGDLAIHRTIPATQHLVVPRFHPGSTVSRRIT